MIVQFLRSMQNLSELDERNAPAAADEVRGPGHVPAVEFGAWTDLRVKY